MNHRQPYEHSTSYYLSWFSLTKRNKRIITSISTNVTTASNATTNKTSTNNKFTNTTGNTPSVNHRRDFLHHKWNKQSFLTRLLFVSFLLFLVILIVWDEDTYFFPFGFPVLPWFGHLTSSSPTDAYPSQPLPLQTKQQLCILVRTYQKQKNNLLSLLLSLSTNPLYMPKVYILGTDPMDKPVDWFHPVMELANEWVGVNFTTAITLDPKEEDTMNPTRPTISSSTSIQEKYPQQTMELDYGYKKTDQALEYLLKNDASCTYFLFTNGDNFYAHGFVDTYISKAMEERIQLIGFHFVSHYSWPYARTHVRGMYRHDGSHIVIRTKFQKGSIDLGAMVIQRDLLTEYPQARFQSFAVQNQNWKTPDGSFAAFLAQKSTRLRIHEEILLFHM